MHYFPCFFRSAIMAVRSSLVKFCTLSQNWQVSSAEPCSSTIFSSSFAPSDSSARSVLPSPVHGSDSSTTSTD